MRGLARVALAHRHACNLQVLGVLLGDDVQGIIDRDDTQDMTVLITDGHGNEVVLGHLVRHLLLVKVGGDPHHIAVGEVLQAVGVIGNHERTHG